MLKPLTLFVDPAWKRGGIYTPLLFPFWGNPIEEVSLFAKEMFDAFPFDTSVYTITDDISAADTVLAPYKHQWFLRYDKALLETCAAAAKDAGLPLLIDGIGDLEFPIGVPHAYVLRIGGYRFIPEERRIIVPPPSDDLLVRCREGKLSIRPKHEGMPTIGFAGWAQLTHMQWARTVLKELPIRVRGLFDKRYRAMKKGVLWRARAIDILRRSPLVSLNLKVRGSFSGSGKTAQMDMRVLREEFVHTVLESDYALDVRGDANASTRLFEILSLGRIPVVIDTERNFPCSDVLDYRQFCIIVDHTDIGRLPEIVAEFHRNVSPEQYEAMQRKAREVFVQYFRTDAQMRHIIRQLPAAIVKTAGR